MLSLALSMIVRDAEADIAGCLESVRHIVDEMVVGDTGSTDRTPEIARQHGARVISIPWEQDFARARNFALASVRSDWVLVLDADEQLDPGAVRSLRPLLHRTEWAGYLVPIRNYMLNLNERVWDRPAVVNDSTLEAARKYPAYVEHENVRLFRHHPDIWFVGRVHESVGPRILAIGGKLGRADFFLHHFGLAADAEIRARKNHLYRELGRQKVREMPGDGQAHFELGLVEFDNFHNYPEALQYFERACQLSPRFSTARFFAGMALGRLERYEEALKYLREAEALGHPSALVAEAQGDAYYSLGQFEAARNCYRRALKRAAGSPDLESKLGLAEIRAGRVEAGLERLHQAIERQPGAGENYDRLITACVWLNRLPDAAVVAERKLEMVESAPKHFLRAASIRAHMDHWERATEILSAGLRRFPEAADLQAALAEAVRQNVGARSPSQDRDVEPRILEGTPAE